MFPLLRFSVNFFLNFYKFLLGGKGREMAQTLYARMSERKKIIRKPSLHWGDS
jgi:hypothetical protein